MLAALSLTALPSTVITTLYSVVGFVFLLTVVVFAHEFGHFYIARRCGVRVEVFSIGFGKAILWWHDKKGTKWQFSLFPIGGYIKMYGDVNAASAPDIGKCEQMNDKEKSISFYYQSLWKKASIIAAGPAANYVLAIILCFLLNYFNGLSVILPEITAIEKGAPAELGGLLVGDRIIKIDEKDIHDFQEIHQALMLSNGASMLFSVLRNNATIIMEISPTILEKSHPIDGKIRVPFIGIGCNKLTHTEVSIAKAFTGSVDYAYDVSFTVLQLLSQILVGERDMSQLGGPMRIAQYSGKSLEMGLEVMLHFIALISLNLGLMNLLPIPLLDGGHLMYYGIQSVYGKPIPPNIQSIGFRLGFLVLVLLFIFATWNDVSAIFFRS